MASGRPNRRLFYHTAANDTSRPPFRLNCPPPPPPLPCPLPPFPEESTTIRFPHSRSSLPALPVAAASVFAVAAIMFLVAFLLILRRRRAPAARDDPVAAAPLEDDDGGDGDGDGDGEEVAHHIWYIRTVGLDESAIESITAWAYKAGDGVLGAFATGCSVCLSEFRDGELVRLLPKCDHAFHLGCIDTWLRSHVNCPLCRAPIIAPTSVAATTALPSSPSLPPPESGLVLAGPSTITSADNDQTTGRQIDLIPGTSEEEFEGERSELRSRNRAVAVPIPSAELQVPADVGADEFLPIRRSFSVNSISPELEQGFRNINNKKKQALEEDSNARTTTRAKHARRANSIRKERGRSLASASDRFVSSVNG